MEEVIGTTKIWGVIMVAIMQPNTAPLIDVNYKTMDACEAVKSETLQSFPNAQIWCTPTYKPESAPKKRKRMATTTRRRTVRR
jgi:hypothetical protein